MKFACRQTAKKTFEVKAWTYNKLVLGRRLRLAVFSIMACNEGGLLLLEEPCTKVGTKTAGEVLAAKHLNFCTSDLSDPDCVCFELYLVIQQAILIDASSDAVEQMAPCLSSGAGPSGIDTVALCPWLLRFVQALGELQEDMA